MATGTYTTHIELDLNAACPLGPNSIADRINDVVPGLKTSTGKLRIYIFTHPTFFSLLSESLMLSLAYMTEPRWACKQSASCITYFGASVRETESIASIGLAGLGKEICYSVISFWPTLRRKCCCPQKLEDFPSAICLRACKLGSPSPFSPTQPVS